MDDVAFNFTDDMNAVKFDHLRKQGANEVFPQNVLLT